MAVVPERLTNFNRTQSELEQLLIFSVAVAGKKAKQIAPKIEKLFEGFDLTVIPPTAILRMWFECRGGNYVIEQLKRARTGNYTRLRKFLGELVSHTPTVHNMTVDSLREFHGISYKTAKMVILHSKPKERHAVLDTHALKFLRLVIGVKDAPLDTPCTSKRYQELETIFLDWVDDRIRYQRHVCLPHPKGGLMDRCVEIERDPLMGKANYAKFDLDLWTVYSGNGRD